MANIEVRKDSQFVKVLAAQARGERLDSKITAEANQIVTDLVSDFSPANRHMFAQTVGYGVDELQQHSLDFLGNVADIKHAGWNEKVAFNIQTRGIMAQINAKGATPSRSYVTEKQVSVDTFEITSRPTIAIGDLLQGRVQMPKLIKEASDAFEREQVTYVQSVLQAGISAKVVDVLRMLTHSKDVPYLDYVRRIADSHNPIAINVKCNDLEHNLERGRKGDHLKQVAKHTAAKEVIHRINGDEGAAWDLLMELPEEGKYWQAKFAFQIEKKPIIEATAEAGITIDEYMHFFHPNPKID